MPSRATTVSTNSVPSAISVRRWSGNAAPRARGAVTPADEKSGLLSLPEGALRSSHVSPRPRVATSGKGPGSLAWSRASAPATPSPEDEREARAAALQLQAVQDPRRDPVGALEAREVGKRLGMSGGELDQIAQVGEAHYLAQQVRES